jgi:heat shock protein HslJ
MLEVLAFALLFQMEAGRPASAAQAGPAPYEGEWVVEVIDKIKVMPDSQVTMKVTRTRISGLASCNTYQGSFTVSEGSVRVGELLKTMKACDGARMIQENDFLAVLRAVIRYEIGRDDTLRLLTGDGKAIVATRAPSTKRQR